MVSEFDSLYQLMAVRKVNRLDSFTDRVMIAVDESLAGDGYDGYSEFADEVANLAKRYIRDSVRESAKKEIDNIRREIRKDFEGVRAERDQLKKELRFYKEIEKAVKSK